MVENTDRALVGEMLKMSDVIDLVVPRGGAELIHFVAENARMPVLIGGTGVCHTYVDRAADLAKAEEIVNNAKCRRPTICNALDTVLVHADVAEAFLPALGRRWAEQGGDALRPPLAAAAAGPGDPRPERCERRPRTTSGRSSWPSWPR